MTLQIMKQECSKSIGLSIKTKLSSGLNKAVTFSDSDCRNNKAQDYQRVN